MRLLQTCILNLRINEKRMNIFEAPSLPLMEYGLSAFPFIFFMSFCKAQQSSSCMSCTFPVNFVPRYFIVLVARMNEISFSQSQLVASCAWKAMLDVFRGRLLLSIRSNHFSGLILSRFLGRYFAAKTCVSFPIVNFLSCFITSAHYPFRIL